MHFKVVVGEDMIDIIDEFEGENENSDDEYEEGGEEKKDDIIVPEPSLKSVKAFTMKSKSESGKVKNNDKDTKTNVSSKNDKKNKQKNVKMESNITKKSSAVKGEENLETDNPDQEITHIFSTDSHENLPGNIYFLSFFLLTC